jgi:hypothetical protein
VLYLIGFLIIFQDPKNESLIPTPLFIDKLLKIFMTSADVFNDKPSSKFNQRLVFLPFSLILSSNRTFCNSSILLNVIFYVPFLLKL